MRQSTTAAKACRQSRLALTLCRLLPGVFQTPARHSDVVTLDA